METAVLDNPTTTRPRGPYLQTERDSFLGRLQTGIRASREKLSRFHRQRVETIREWCGPRYAEAEMMQSPPKPLATLFSYFSIVMPSLTARRLALKGVGRLPWFDGLSMRLAALTGLRLDDLDAAVTVLEPVIADTLFGGWGVSKIGMEAGPEGGPECEDWIRDPGEAFWSRVAPERYLFDPRCTIIRTAQWQGDEFFIGPYELERKYGERGLRVMDGRETRNTHETGSSETISGTPGGEPLYPMYRIAEVYLPREQAVLTVPAEEGDWTSEFIDERPYVGPEGGPYDMLDFERPPDNPLGVSVISQLMDMDELLNAVMTKVAWRIANRKDVTVVSPGNTKTGYGVRDARDGEVLEGDPKSVARLSFGGADVSDWNAINQLREIMNYYAGNPDSIGGLEANAKTLGQDQLKFQNAATKLGRWAGRAIAYANRCVRRVAWYQAARPMMEDDGSAPRAMLEGVARRVGAQLSPISVPLRQPGTSSPTIAEWTTVDSQDALANFGQIALSIDAYAAAELTPEQQYQAKRELVLEVVLPSGQLLAAQGVQVDMAALITGMAEDRGLRDTSRWFHPAPPQPVMQAPMMQAPMMQQPGGNKTTNISIGGAPRGRPMPENPTATTQATESPNAEPPPTQE